MSVPRGVLICLPLVVCGCTGGGEETPPAKQYEEAMAHVGAGHLTSAWRSLLPPSFERDLDAVLAKLVRLVDEDEHAALLDALSSGGRKLAGLIALAGSDDPFLELVTAKLDELPRVLGIDTYERFRKLSVASLLAALETGFVSEVVQLESVRQKIASISFELKERRRDWARLTVRFDPPDGEAATDQMDLIRFEGRWIPGDWVTDWPATMHTFRERIDAAMKLKEETPAAFEKSLAAIREAMQNPTSLLKSLPDLRRHFGLGKAAASR